MISLELIKIHARVVLSSLFPFARLHPVDIVLMNFINEDYVFRYFKRDPHKTLEQEKHDLELLMLELPNFKHIPGIVFFHQLCLIHTKSVDLHDGEIIKIDETFLRNAEKHARLLGQHFHGDIYGGYIDKNLSLACSFFCSWLTPKAIALHQFDATALQVAELCWDHLLHEIRATTDKNFIEAFNLLRPLLKLYSDHLKNRLMQLRATAKLQQTEYTALCEKIARLEKSLDEQDHIGKIHTAEIKESLRQEEDSKPSFKEALINVTAVLRFHSVFKGMKKEKLPSAVSKMLELSTITKSCPTEKASQTTVHMPQNNKKTKHEKEFPGITSHLFDLSTLKKFNEQIKLLLAALEASYFLLPWKKKFHADFIQLTKSFNDCFEMKNISNEKLIEKGNIFLQQLIYFICHYPFLDYFIGENQNDFGKNIKAFIFFYCDTLKMELNALFVIYEDMRTSNAASEKYAYSLQLKLDQNPTSIHSFQIFPQKTNTDPCKKALLHVVAIILSANDILNSPQLIPALMEILQDSYAALIPFQLADPQVAVSAPEPQTQHLVVTDATCQTPPLSFLGWEHLELLNQAGQTLLPDMWLLLRNAMESFNNQFLPDAIRKNENPTLKANMALLHLMQLLFANNRSMWLPFISLYNHFVEDTIEQLHMCVQEKKTHVRLLGNFIDELNKKSNCRK